MHKIQLKKNDLVVVIRGKDKGKTGKVLKLFPETERVIVERINFSKHFVRADRSKNVQGGVMEKETPIHVSNVMLYCSECGQGVRVRRRRLEGGDLVRLCHKCESQIEKQK
jgi:large subunit ribosomal protein L24